jgi:hypothetical protein
MTGEATSALFHAVPIVHTPHCNMRDAVHKPDIVAKARPKTRSEETLIDLVRAIEEAKKEAAMSP